MVLLLAILLPGCKWDYSDSPPDPPSEFSGEAGVSSGDYTFWGFKYSIDDNTLLIHNIYPETNVVQLAKSEDNFWIVYSKVSSGGNINLFKMHRNDLVPVQITNTEGIEFDPAIDNDGNVAWVYHSYSTDRSEVYLNNSKIDIPVGLYKNCFIFNSILFFS
jgi:hypothetical protein